MKNPIKIRKQLVRKVPTKLLEDKYNIDGFMVREITFKDINEDTWLNNSK
ncbi:hypothetical protein [Clostridium algidicarnis]|uniref:Uncharacterized protein n=1 Tax=Clostridium algidicarnis TaxID=37659 RepID=A0ABS6C5B8_9CLOT|nr:hypothetical protein [Clostridium algidicarnis]MBU3220655.1 hypothetical protein [Clostridium algidicarnis]